MFSSDRPSKSNNFSTKWSLYSIEYFEQYIIFIRIARSIIIVSSFWLKVKGSNYER